jgi:hypothetical protein
MDLELRVSDLLVPPYEKPKPIYETTIEDNGAAVHVYFRLPTGADQEAAAALMPAEAEAVELVLQRCVREITVEGETRDMSPDRSLPDAVGERLPTLLSELDPQAELLFEVSCPICSHTFSALLDAAAYFLEEIRGRSAHLYREVHLLALYYHWSEAEIMGMSVAKRQRYLRLLEEVLAERGSP